MKKMSRMMLVLSMALVMLAGFAISSYAALASYGVVSESKSELKVENKIDFETTTVKTADGGEHPRTHIEPGKGTAVDSIYHASQVYMDMFDVISGTKKKPNYPYKFDITSANSCFYAVKTLADGRLYFSYDPAKDATYHDPDKNVTIDRIYGAESNLMVSTAKLSSRLEKDGKSAIYTKDTFDFVSVSFDVMLENPQANFIVSLENTPQFYLMLIDTEGNVYLRTNPGSSSTEVAEEYDTKIGQIALGEFTTFTINFYPQKGTVGYYDYTIEFDGMTAGVVNEASCVYMSSITDDASFLNDNTFFKWQMTGTDGLPTEASRWGIDNIYFRTYNYRVEPEDVVDDLSELQENVTKEFVSIWASHYQVTDIINMGEVATLINGADALRFPAAPGAATTNPSFQVPGTTENSKFALSLKENGFVFTAKEAGQFIDMRLYKKNGNAYLPGDYVAETFKVSFRVNGNPALSLKLNSKLGVDATDITFDLGAYLTAGMYNDVELIVAGEAVTLKVNGELKAQDTILRQTDGSQHQLTLSLGMPTTEVEIDALTLSEQQDVTRYIAIIAGQEVELSVARANYWRYLYDKSIDPEVKPYDPLYNTFDREAVRPTGTLKYNSDTFFYDGQLSFVRWGNYVSPPAGRCDVTFWGTATSSIDAETGLETNGYLRDDFEGYTENGAVVFQMNRENMYGNTDLYHTAGFQYNTKKADGMQDLGQDAVPQYYRMSFSIWYDSVTFPEAGFTLRYGPDKDSDASGDDPGRKGLMGQVLLTINQTDKGPILTIPNTRMGKSLKEDQSSEVVDFTSASGTNFRVNSFFEDALQAPVEVELEEGWNTISIDFYLVFAKTTTDTRLDADGGTTSLSCMHAVNRLRYTVNGDYVYHTPEDLTTGYDFYLDNGIDHTAKGGYIEGTALLHSTGTELDSELERIKWKTFKLEFLEDKLVPVNAYEKGTEADDVVRFTDFDADMQEDIESIQALKDIINNPNIPENERNAAKDKLAILEKEVMQRQLSVQTDGDVKLINQNSRLIITHQGANTSVSEVFYDLATLSTGNAMTFDFSFYKGKIYDEANGWALTDTTAPKVEVFVGGATVLTIEENGMLMAGGKALGQCKASGWNNISVVLERENENSPYLLTVYLAGEIVLFRGEMTQPDAISRVGIRSTGENKDQFRLDNLALSLGNIPTSVVYMHPITYVVGDGQMALNTEEGYHIIGKRKETFPTVGIEGAIFSGWYYDKEFTSKANFVRASYTQPVVLYAKYDYRVTFNLNKEGQVNPPDIISCGQITMPIVNGVSYWFANVNGKDVFLECGATYQVTGNANFIAYSEGKDTADILNSRFIVSVLNIDSTLNYETVASAVDKADEYYAALSEEQKQVAIVQTYKEVLEGIKDAQAQKLADAERYLQWFAILSDKELTYAQRYEAYYEMDEKIVGVSADGKEQTFRDTVDVTCPGIFEANGELSIYKRSLDRAKEGVIELILAIEGYNRNQSSFGSLYQHFQYASSVAQALKYCYDKAETRLVTTYTLTAEDLLLTERFDAQGNPLFATDENGQIIVDSDGKKVLLNKADALLSCPASLEGDVAFYLTQAKAIVESYNDRTAIINSETETAQRAANTFTTSIFKGNTLGRVPGAIVAIVDNYADTLKELLEKWYRIWNQE
ncbi:MAG: hypothetical protein J6R42_02915 [Clostridia bacterium]|nr:hypothetical protein [Clostridia bacterium]